MPRVQDVMAKSPAICTPETPIPQIARMMVEHDCGAIPVVDSQENPLPIGIITDRDIVVRLVAEERCPLEAVARAAMSDGVATVSPMMSMEEAAEVMERHQVRRVPVVDEAGKVIGVLSQADVVLNTSAEDAAELLREVSEEESLLKDQMPMGGAYSS